MARRSAALLALAGTRLAAAAVSITASPANVSGPSASLTVAYSGVVSPQSTDWVAAYCVGAPETSFGPWTYVTACSGWASGACSLPFSLQYSDLNCPSLEFRLYRDPSPYTLLGTSNAVIWTAGPGANSLRHVRVSYGAVPQSEMHMSVTSDDGASPVVIQLGTASGVYSLPNTTAADAVTYYAEDSCGTPAAWSFPGYFHHALLTGLTPATRYYARAVQGSTIGREVSWVTGKPLGADVATAFAAFCDMGTSGGSGAVDTVARLSPRLGDLDFVLHAGDLSYGEGVASTWRTWMGLIEPVSSALPYHVSIGNHEYDYPSSQDGSKDPSGAGKMWSPPFWNGGYDSGGECGVPASRHFRAPGTGNGVFWYSFSSGNVHVAMISSEHDPSPGAPMGDWLAQDLAAVDRSVTPWLLLGIHRPLVETEMYPGDFAVAAGLRGILEPLLLQHNVDVVIAGHYHSFQRSCSMANLTCVQSGGIVHYTTGAAGASLDAVSLYPSNYIETTILGRFGYSLVSAPNASALQLVFHANDDDSVLDEVWITK